jgi:4'-phosphopantetheinyl transferase
VRRRSECQKIAQRCFHEREQAYLAGVGDSDYAGEFTKVWTAKEAFVKYTGEGLRRALNSFAVVLQPELSSQEQGKISEGLETTVEYRAQRGFIEGTPVVLYVWDFVEGYRLTVCCEAGEVVDMKMIASVPT